MEKVDFNAFQEIGDQSEDIYFIYDLDTNQFNYLNAAFDLVWKISSQDMLKNQSLIMDTVFAEDKQHVLDTYHKFLEVKSKETLNFRIVWPTKIDRWLRLKVYPIVQKDTVRYVAGIVEDESARVKIIFNMQKVNARKDSALEILAHDLRGPIGIVQNLASLIEKKLPAKENKQINEWTALIKKTCKRNIDLIRDLINQEFLESAEIEISKERIDVVGEINEVIYNYQKSQENIAKVFKLTFSHDKIYAQADSTKFMQIMNNLISNALKFTPEGGIIQIHIHKKKDTVLITVNDNGIGIPEALQPLLFDKFTRAKRTGLKGEESLGLGMSIIKTMVELHNGKIWFESTENKGTTFFVELPEVEN